VLAVRRHDAAHRLVLHVLELRQQHRLRVGPRRAAAAAKTRWRAPLRRGPRRLRRRPVMMPPSWSSRSTS
jgi:hypothetical protein